MFREMVVSREAVVFLGSFSISSATFAANRRPARFSRVRSVAQDTGRRWSPSYLLVFWNFTSRRASIGITKFTPRYWMPCLAQKKGAAADFLPAVQTGRERFSIARLFRLRPTWMMTPTRRGQSPYYRHRSSHSRAPASPHTHRRRWSKLPASRAFAGSAASRSKQLRIAKLLAVAPNLILPREPRGSADPWLVGLGFFPNAGKAVSIQPFIDNWPAGRLLMIFLRAKSCKPRPTTNCLIRAVPITWRGRIIWPR